MKEDYAYNILRGLMEGTKQDNKYILKGMPRKL